MGKVNFPRGYKVYVPLLIFFVLLLLLMPGSHNFNYDYRKGSAWMYDNLVAQFDFPLLKTEAQMQEERNAAGSGIIPYYKYSEEIVAENLRTVGLVNLGEYDMLKSDIQKVLSKIYSYGVIGNIDEAAPNAQIIYIQKEKRAMKYPVAETYTVSQARSFLRGEIQKSHPKYNVDSIFMAGGIYDCVTANLEFDRQTTDLVHDDAANYISPTQGMTYAGHLIVSTEEIVTAEIEQMLDSYKAEYDKNLGYTGSKFLLWTGNGIIALLITVLLFFTILFTNPFVFNDFNRYCYVLLIVFIAALASFLVERTGQHNLYLVPFSLIALYLVAFFQSKVVYPVYIISLLPMLIFAHGGIELFIMYLVAGVVGIFSFNFFNRGWQQFVTAFLVFVSLVVTFFAFRLLDGLEGFDGYKTIVYLGLGSLFSVAGYPLVYLFEKIFNLVSNVRLVELSDTNNRLLQELAHKAPGTFQHSLQVMNMADAAARAIDAQVPLVRCGALYHDIGKILNPLCFIENETSAESYHKDLTPLESAREIIKHVPEGYAIAEKAGLPDVVKDFIVTHHGTTSTAYFYNKFIQEGGDPSQAEEFYYSGHKPVSKEQVILMLCDTIEAASRTLKDFSQQSISDFVERIFNSKMQDGQFEESDISLKELNILKNIIMEYLQQAHHARVSYPRKVVSARANAQKNKQNK